MSTTIGNCQPELDALCARYAPKHEPNPNGHIGGTGHWSTGLTDEQVLANAKAAKNGEAFAGLYERGDLTGHEGDPSTANLALVGILAFWTGPDPVQIDRLFRGSKLMRPKWDSKRGGSTWGADTIDKALSQRGPNDYYRKSKSDQTQRGAKAQITILTVKELFERQEPPWLVKGMLPQGSLAAIVGAPGSFKTFAALYLAFCVAMGLPVAEHPVQQVPALVISAEGFGGLSRRFRALQHHHGISDVPHLHIIAQVVDLRSATGVAALTDAITAMDASYGLIVVDTLARCMPGADENSAKEMGEAIDGLAQLAELTGATVMILHHTTKSDRRTIRGSSALLGALDVEMLAERSGDVLTLTNTKMKDAEEFEPHYFDTKVIELGPEQSSLVLIRRSEPPANEAHGEGPRADRVLRVLDELLEQRTEVPHGVWRDACKRAGITKATFDRGLEDLRAEQPAPIQSRPSGNSVLYRRAAKSPFERMTSTPHRDEADQ